MMIESKRVRSKNQMKKRAVGMTILYSIIGTLYFIFNLY